MDRSGRWIAWIILATALSFSPAISFFFLSDDFYLIETAKNSSIKALFSSESWVYYRPLLLLSHAVEYPFWKASPGGYHATNVFLHLLNTILFCLLSRRLLRSAGNSWIFAGILFGLTPVHASSVLWILGRTDLLCGTFYLFSVLTFFLYLEKGHPVIGGASIFSFIGALLCKEMAGSIPLVCLIWGVIFFRKGGNFKNSFAKALKASWAYFFVLALYFGLRYLLFGHFPHNPVHGAPSVGYFLTNIGRYGVGLILPFDLEVIKPFFRPRPSLLIVGSLVLIGLSLVLLRLVIARRPLVFASTWIGITLLPVLKFFKFYEPWHLYIPSVGVALGLGYLLGAFVWKKEITWIGRWIVATIIGIHLLGLAQIEYNTMIASRMSERVLTGLIQYVPAAKNTILINAPSEYRGVPVLGEKENVLIGLQLLGHPRHLQVLTSVRYAALKDPVHISFARAEKRIGIDLEGGRNFFQLEFANMLTGRIRSQPGDIYQTPDTVIEVKALNATGKPSSLMIRSTWLEDPSIPVLAYSEGQIRFVK